MRYSIIISLILSMAVLLSACQKTTGEGELRSPGEKAFKSNCQTCHILPKAKDKTDEEWPALVNRYGEKARLSQTDIDNIISYLTSNN